MSFASGTSSLGKRSQDSNDCAIGDKVDLRICTSSPSGKTIDLINVEFAKDTNSNKFHADHRKVLREGKPREKKNISVPCMQIGGIEGQKSEVQLVDNSQCCKWSCLHYT
ncbi:uncharacterized protein EV154DRAFT_479420 [Mucor mucedo]|uniref:uncharacterized protein n=1 Tax=Mucor mucedo TaxID=29922 RepID=UPI002220B625|nr:uncharacterized protein EV154DRAFT_479420 [Mucor mucedo]KAI7893418.1 hypothetical protein EV154DRAFT_479420 [Mucor mucedo]